MFELILPNHMMFVYFLCQDKRLGALNRFKSKGCNIITCTNVASCGLDIRGVDVVINYDIPSPKVSFGSFVLLGDQVCVYSIACSMNVRKVQLFRLYILLCHTECSHMYIGWVGLHVQDGLDTQCPW